MSVIVLSRPIATTLTGIENDQMDLASLVAVPDAQCTRFMVQVSAEIREKSRASFGRFVMRASFVACDGNHQRDQGPRTSGGRRI